MHLYYKIPPQVAERFSLTDFAPCHPDGWYLITANKAVQIAATLPKREDGSDIELDDAIESLGGVGYDSAQAIASQKGERQYMMNLTEEERNYHPIEGYKEEPQEEPQEEEEGGEQ